MSTGVHLDWQGATHLIGRVFPQARGSPVSFEYDRSWLDYPVSFSIDPTGLPLQRAALLRATEALHRDTETAQDLKFLLGEGSPLGGARPKFAVQLPDGSCGIAKFPKPDDFRDIAASEILTLTLTLARRAGFRTADHQLVSSKSGGISVITRFDRHGPQRIPFLPASSLLGLPPDQPGAYTLIADGIRQFGGDVIPDLHELWRRMVFSLLASNFDDHLRNHGFLMHQPGRWSLSPAYDLNPVPAIDRGRFNKTSITEDDSEPTPGLALAAAQRFGLKPAQARTILREVVTALAEWHPTGKRLRIKATTLNVYESAFDHDLEREAESILGRS